MIKVIIGNLDFLTDNKIHVDSQILFNTDIPQISKTIWSFNFDDDTNTGEIEFQVDQQKNNQTVDSLAELESAIGCSLQSIKDIHTANYVAPPELDEE